MIEKGFADQATESAVVFRAIMTAMARPGRIVALEAGLNAPAPMLEATAAVALTLCDFQTPVWLAPDFRTPAIESYLRFHTGANLSASPGQAAFAFATGGQGLPGLQGFSAGTLEYPDRSTTLVLQVRDLSNTGPVTLSGPGIDGTTRLAVDGLDGGFWAAMSENHGRFPLGADVIFVSASSIAACPRSTAISIRQAA